MVKRYALRRRADGFWFHGGERFTNEAGWWVSDFDKARTFTNSGHPRLAVRPRPSEIIRRQAWSRDPLYAQLVREWFDARYEIVPLKLLPVEDKQCPK